MHKMFAGFLITIRFIKISAFFVSVLKAKNIIMLQCFSHEKKMYLFFHLYLKVILKHSIKKSKIDSEQRFKELYEFH